MNTLLRDFRHGFRTLAKSPGFTAVAPITLALGIGANTVIFSVVEAVLFKVLPYPKPQRLVALLENERCGRTDGGRPKGLLLKTDV